MADDPVKAFLDSLNTSNRVRKAAWDAVYDSADSNDLQRRLASLPFSDQVRSQLWELKFGSGEVPEVAAQAAPAATTEQPSAASRFFSNAGEMLNPATAVKGVWNALPIPQALGGAGVIEGPANTGKAIWNAQSEQFGKAADDFSQGRYLEMLGHGAAGVLPLIGPAAATAGEQIAQGDVAGGLGKATGIIAPVGVAGAMRGRVAAKNAKGVPATLERQAANQVAQQVLAPGNVAFKGKAQQVAPEVLRRGMKGGREELAAAAEEGQAVAAQSIDDAIAAGGGGQSGVYIDPVIAPLKRKIDSLTVNGRPIPGAEGRIAGLQARIDYLEQVARQRQGLVRHGQPFSNPKALSFDDLRKIRDEQYRIANEAKAYERRGNPILSDEGFAAAETGSAVRSEFARLSPELAQANADYTFFKTLGDVLDPAQGRPKVSAPSQGVTGGAATSGAAVGALVSPKAAFVLGVVRPWIKRMQSEPAWQLADAQSKMRLAQAIRDGDVSTAQKIMVRIGEGVVAGQATNPSESRRPTAPAYSTP